MRTLSRYQLLSGTAFLILAAAGATYSCKGFLDAPPQGTLDDQTLANAAGVEGSLIAAYRVLDWNNGVGGDWGWAASNWVWGSVTSDDAYKGSEPTDQPPVTDIELYNWTTGGAQAYLNDKWRGAYEGVVRSNATLRLLNTVLADNPAALSAADADGIRGEALFLRAHYHFEAWRMWGNIPYYTEDDLDFRKTNVGVDAITNILADLDEAISLLPVLPRKGQVGRVKQWTAKAYKGRVQIYDGDYAGALTTLREVRQSAVYALEANFHRVWTAFGQYANGKETILAYQASANDGEPNGNNANYGERLNFPHNPGAPGGCCGFHQPSQNLVNYFRVDANGLPLALSDPGNWNASSAEFDSTGTAAVDPRLDWTVGRDGVPYKDYGTHRVGWIRTPSYGGPYSPKKNVHEDASGAEQVGGGWFPTQQNNMNIHIYRYADMLLLLAEAEVEAGDPENARTIINEIRTRAGVVAQGPGTSATNLTVGINDASITWANYEVGLYTTPFASQADARAAVRAERRLELAMEGHRFFDLRRWGQIEQVLNDYLTVEKTRRSYLTAAASVTARYNLYPIPTIQIELSKVGAEERIVQNTEW